MTQNEMDAREAAQVAANKHQKPVHLLRRSCDRWMFRLDGEEQSALAYASLVATFKPTTLFSGGTVLFPILCSGGTVLFPML